MGLVIACGQVHAMGVPQKPAAGPSDAEMKAAKAVEAVPEIAPALVAAADFIKKYPKSELLKPMGTNIASKISKYTVVEQQLTFAESYRTTFKGTSAADIIIPVIVDVDGRTNKFDDAFKEGADYLSRNQTDIATMTRLALLGVDQAKHGNPKFIADSQTYALATIAILEAPQKPDAVDQSVFDEYKTTWLAPLHQASGVCSLVSGKNDEALARFKKAAAVDPKDPTTYLLMGTVANRQYQPMVDKYNKMTPGPDATEALKQAQAQLDVVIDYYAHAVGLSEGNEKLKDMHDQILEDLTGFYTYRHQGKKDGLQELIDKYKPAK
jgi:tetratricopeptide (TPR) repeat protein